MTVLFVVLFLLAALGGWVVATAREPLRQSMAAGIFGLFLAALMFAYQAPDVALSALVTEAVALPLMILLAIAKTRSQPK